MTVCGGVPTPFSVGELVPAFLLAYVNMRRDVSHGLARADVLGQIRDDDRANAALRMVRRAKE